MQLQFNDFGYPVELELVTVEDELLTLKYCSFVEGTVYLLQSKIDVMAELIIGIAPYGGVAIWSSSMFKSFLLQWLNANPLSSTKKEIDSPSSKMPPRNLFDKYMQQFTYRYLPIYEKWDGGEEQWAKYEEDEKRGSELDYIEEALYDGTHDKLHDGGLMEYHQAGKPKKLHVQWHIGKSEYSAYFWFEDERIREVFDKFYGAHPDTKTDFIIRIDAGQRKYELALYRYGLKESQVIPEDAYQLLVFKNKFEDYRSENYNQERGAWIW